MSKKDDRLKSDEDVRKACEHLRRGATRTAASKSVGRHKDWLSAAVSKSKLGNRTWIWRVVEDAEKEFRNAEKEFRNAE